MEKDIVYIELDDWFRDNDYPRIPIIEEWLNAYNLDKYLRNDEWAKANKLCIKWLFIDMSVDFMITAPLSFVKEVIPDILKEENAKFITYPTEDGKLPESRYCYNEYFLEYKEENIGSFEYPDGDDNYIGFEEEK
jgi:hypothetical protein